MNRPRAYPKPPIAIPRQAVLLLGLRTNPNEHSCYLEYSDREGRFHEKAVSFAAGARFLKWLGAHRLTVPVRVRPL